MHARLYKAINETIKKNARLSYKNNFVLWLFNKGEKSRIEFKREHFTKSGRLPRYLKETICSYAADSFYIEMK